MKKLAIAFAATMLVLTVFAAVRWNELQSERDKLAGLQTRLSGLEGAQRASTAAATDTLLAATPTIAESAIAEVAQQPEAALPQAELSRTEKAYEQGFAAGLAQLSAEGLRPQIEARYSDLAGDLGLSQADAARFLDLIVRQQGGFAEFSASVQGKTREEMWRINNARILAEEREQAAMLGSKYPQWQAYQGTVSARQMIKELKPLLGSGEDALTDAQFPLLAAAMGAEIARNSKESQDRLMAAPPPSENSAQSNSQYAAERDRRIVDAASVHLTPDQLEHFRQMLARKSESRARLTARDEAVKARMASGAQP